MKPGNRHAIDECAAVHWDLLVLGGGINGAGIARDAAMRGLKVLLLERRDFGFGASSRSTKLAHGGLRYLETRDFALVREAMLERGILMNTLAPHLVHPQPFLIPHYQGDARPPWMVKAGLWLYDALAWGSSIQPHRSYSRAGTLELEPGLSREGLRGSSQYWDARMNDARLVLENVLDAERHGARCLNYCALVSAHALAAGGVRVKVRDEEAEREAELRGSLLINASGAWADESLGRLGRPPVAPVVKPTKGVHLITRPLTSGGRALLIPARGDRRVFFVIPFHHAGREASLVGTTDTDFSGDKDHVRAEQEDIEYLAAETRRVLPGAAFKPADIWSTYAGLRPLTAPTPSRTTGAPAGLPLNSAVSREFQVLEQEGLLTITGGKYTTYRRLAEQVVDKALAVLRLPGLPCRTAAKPLPGAPKNALEREWLGGPAASELALGHGVARETAAYLLRNYGMAARAVLELAQEDPLFMKPLAPDSPAIVAQAVYAARHEKLARLDDFYLRRTFLGLELAPDHKGVDKVAEAVGKELWWPRDREADELDHLKRVVAGEFR